MFKYGIMFKPTKELVSFQDKHSGKQVLYSDNIESVEEAIFDITIADGGYDGDADDFKIITADVPDNFDGSDYVKDNKDSVFFDKNIIS